MSDNGRQSMTESAANAMTVFFILSVSTLRFGILTVLAQPDSAKSTTQQMGDKMSGAMDSLAGSMQPNVTLFFSYPPLTVTNPIYLSQ